MGAWGPGPFDNDRAADWLGPLTKRLAVDIRRALLGDGEEEIRAAAWLLGQVAVSPYTYDVELREQHLCLAMERLQTIAQRRRDEGLEEDACQIDEEINHLRDVASGRYDSDGFLLW